MALVVSGLGMLTGAALLWRATRDWPETEATILTCRVEPKDGSRYVKLILEYEYRVEDQQYTNTELSPVQPNDFLTKRTAQHWQQTLTPGKTHILFYDPSRPDRSFLQRPRLYQDVLFRPPSIVLLGAWMLLLYRQTRRRTAPAGLQTSHPADDTASGDFDTDWIVEIEESPLVLTGTTPHPKFGGLMSGWPECRTAVVVLPDELLVVPGPYTRRGLCSCGLTLLLELSLSLLWIPAVHSLVILLEVRKRHRNWKRLKQSALSLADADDGGIHAIPITRAILHGFDQPQQQLWYRLPDSQMDEFLQLTDADVDDVTELLDFVGMLQAAQTSNEPASP